MDEAGFNLLVDTFYARVRRDDLIGPIFNAVIDDWPLHLKTLSRFWNAVMLTSGRYKGQPILAHVKHREQITPAMFDRWLGLWRETTNELMRPEAATALQAKAERMSGTLQNAMFHKPARKYDHKGKPMPPEPYGSSPVFDENTLPDALRNHHTTKEGVWGLLRVLEGRVTLVFPETGDEIEVNPKDPAPLPPAKLHYVKTHGPMRMQVDFYREHPFGKN